jgi:site-specific recombinase XerD
MLKNHNISDVVEVFLDDLARIRRYSDNTVKSYRRDLYDFTAFCSERGKNDLKTIDARLLKNYLIELGEKKLNASSVARKLSTLRHFFKYSFTNNIIESNPAAMVKNPKVKRPLPETITQEQYKQIISLIEKEETKKKKYSPQLVKAVFELLYGCSLRVSEVCNLKRGDVDLKAERLRVRGKGNKIRYVPVGEKSRQVLIEYIETQPDRTAADFFLISKEGKKLYPELIYRFTRNFIGKVSEIQKRGPHSLRHSSATHMLDSGADITAIKEILGHENLSTTQIYTHVSIEQLKNIYKKSHPKS